MGVDVGVKVRIFGANDSVHEVTVSDQDNSLMSLLSLQTSISYTSIAFDKAVLTEEEQHMLFFNEVEEMLMESEMIESPKLLAVLDKLWRVLYRKESEALSSDLKAIDAREADLEKREKLRKTVISEYFGFEMSFSRLLGIVKVAAATNSKVQLILEFY